MFTYSGRTEELRKNTWAALYGNWWTVKILPHLHFAIAKYTFLLLVLCECPVKFRSKNVTKNSIFRCLDWYVSIVVYLPEYFHRHDTEYSAQLWHNRLHPSIPSVPLLRDQAKILRDLQLLAGNQWLLMIH